MRSAVCRRKRNYFLLCFTSTETTDLFHSCGAQIPTGLSPVQLLLVVADDTTQAKEHEFGPGRLRLDIRKKISITKRVQHGDRLPQNMCKASILGGFKDLAR